MPLKTDSQIFLLLWINTPFCCDFFWITSILCLHVRYQMLPLWFWILFSLILDTCFLLELKNAQIQHKHMWHLLFFILRLETLISSVREKKQNNANVANYPHTAKSEDEVKGWKLPHTDNVRDLFFACYYSASI